ncbi:MAG: hypothetical protein HFF99_02405 [Oscillibacter sp.]|nr:hypothetical protein [uncultured Oscillibacter sp.]MCI8970294.1 hypothetical protein [Oscillibacter sp.]
MAQAYPYWYNGKWRCKQDKCRTSMSLDKARIWLDFNEFCELDSADGAPIYLFSQGDIVSDSAGKDVELREGMEVSVFDEDLGPENRPDPILAEGVVLRNTSSSGFLGRPQVKWLLRLKKCESRENAGSPYVYWLSDLE